MNGSIMYYVILGICGLVMGVFFLLRGLKKFQAWRDGEKDELWSFLALIIGCALGIILGMAMTFPNIFGETLINDLGPLLVILCLIPVGLYTFYYILKWREAK